MSKDRKVGLAGLTYTRPTSTKILDFVHRRVHPRETASPTHTVSLLSGPVLNPKHPHFHVYPSWTLGCGSVKLDCLPVCPWRPKSQKHFFLKQHVAPQTSHRSTPSPIRDQTSYPRRTRSTVLFVEGSVDPSTNG